MGNYDSYQRRVRIFCKCGEVFTSVRGFLEHMKENEVGWPERLTNRGRQKMRLHGVDSDAMLKDLEKDDG